MHHFEWDKNKNIVNLKKHQIAFEEAKTVFLDENALLLDDPDSSADEERFLMLGFSSRLHMLLVCHCYRGPNTVRIISARRASKKEAALYAQENV